PRFRGCLRTKLPPPSRSPMPAGPRICGSFGRSIFIEAIRGSGLRLHGMENFRQREKLRSSARGMERGCSPCVRALALGIGPAYGRARKSFGGCAVDPVGEPANRTADRSREVIPGTPDQLD